MGLSSKEEKSKANKGITMKTKLLLPLLSLTLGTLPLLAELKYFPKDKDELISLVADESIKLDEIDVSKIKDMSYLFCLARDNSRSYPYEEGCGRVFRKDFRGIEKWDTSNVEDMARMFDSVENFNEPIGSWNVSKVKNMDRVFARAISFNQPLNKWNVSNVEDMGGMFAYTKFNQPLDSWDVSNVEDMTKIFYGAKSFNQDLSMWKVSNLKEYGSWWREMFEGSPLEKDKNKQFKF